MTRRSLLRSALVAPLLLWASFAVAAQPTIIVDNGGTGSDTAASGAGPAVALTGSSASTSATGLVITLDGSPDLANVAVDGSHVLWLATASGRQFAAITAKDNTLKTVTTTTAYTASLTGQSWAIGGKRATLDNANTRKLFSADYGNNWAVDVREAGTNHVLTSAISIGLTAPLLVMSSSTNRPTITTATNSTRLFTFPTANGTTFQHLQLTNTAATRAAAIYQGSTQTSGMVVADCSFDGFTYAIEGNNSAGGFFSGLVVDSSEFKNCTTGCIYNNSVTGSVLVFDSFFHDNASTNACLSGSGAWAVDRCVFARNDRPINVAGGSLNYLSLRNSVVQGSTNATLANAAVTLSSTSISNSAELVGNVFWGNAATAASMTGNVNLVQRSNAYGSNGANRLNFASAASDVTLTADPFASAAGNDFTLNNTAGGGALLRSIPRTLPGLAGTSYPDLGAYQHRQGGRAN